MKEELFDKLKHDVPYGGCEKVTLQLFDQRLGFCFAST